jgi:hypothetical protein
VNLQGIAKWVFFREQYEWLGAV